MVIVDKPRLIEPLHAFIVTGDRYATFDAWGQSIAHALDRYRREGKVVCIHGDQRGIDTLAEQWCASRNIATIPMPYIDSLGKAGGPARNSEMARVLKSLQTCGYQIAVHAFHNYLEGSKGTADMIDRAKAYGIETFLYSSKGTMQQL